MRLMTDQKSSILYLLCGIIASGKSTWAKNNREKLNAFIISQDNIREMIHGRYLYIPEHEHLVKSIATNSAKMLINSRYNVIIDECWSTISPEFRKETIYTISPKKVIAVNFTKIIGNVENRMKESKGVPKEVWNIVYKKMLEVYKPATTNESYINDIWEVSI